MICKLCNYPLEEYVVHEGARDEPPTTRIECVVCGPLHFQTLLPIKREEVI